MAGWTLSSAVAANAVITNNRQLHKRCPCSLAAGKRGAIYDRREMSDSEQQSARPLDWEGPRSVLLVVPTWMRDGGVSAHVQASARLLARRGLDVHVLCARVESRDTAPGVTVHHSAELFNQSAALEARVVDALAFAPDIVHFHQLEDPDLVRSARAQAPVVVSSHQYTVCTSGQYYLRPGVECTRSHGVGCLLSLATHHCSPGFPRKQVPLRYRGRTRRLEALRRADLVVSYSSSVDRHLAANGLTKRRIVPLFTTIPAKPRPACEGQRRVLFAGRIVGVKGLPVLLRAARDVDAEFVVCGDGRQLDQDRELAKRLGVGPRVRFIGWLAADDLARQIASASVVALPSLWPEPFGLVGIEALAAGRPVVASDTGGVVDWLEHGVNGLRVRAGDATSLASALTALLDDPQRRAAMGNAGRATIDARFSPQAHLDALLGCYLAASENWRAGRTQAADRRAI